MAKHWQQEHGKSPALYICSIRYTGSALCRKVRKSYIEQIIKKKKKGGGEREEEKEEEEGEEEEGGENYTWSRRETL